MHLHEEGGGKHRLRQAQLCHLVLRIDGGDGLELFTREEHAHVYRDPADDCEHAHAAVLQLRFAEVVDGERVGDAQGVGGPPQ